MSVQQGVPNTGAPLVDSAGRLNQVWFRFFVTIWQRTGGAMGAAATVTGAPASGALAVFSGPSSITDGDLSGDVITAGSAVASLAVVNASPGTYALANVTVDGKGRVTLATAAATTGTGNVARAVSPVFTTPSLGAATASSINGLTISSTSANLAVANGGALATFGAFSILLTASGPTNLTLPTSGTVTALGNTTTGSGAIVRATSPSLTTPNIGAATGTSLVCTGGIGGSFVQTATVNVSALPTPTPALVGERSFVDDSTVTAAGNFGAILVGGGANPAPAYCDGANWRIG